MKLIHNAYVSNEHQTMVTHTRDVGNELLIVLYLDIQWGTIKTNIFLSRFIQGLHNGVLMYMLD